MQGPYARTGRNNQDIYRLILEKSKSKKLVILEKEIVKLCFHSWICGLEKVLHVYTTESRAAGNNRKLGTAYISINERRDLFPLQHAAVEYYIALKTDTLQGHGWVCETGAVKKTNPRRQIKLHTIVFKHTAGSRPPLPARDRFSVCLSE